MKIALIPIVLVALAAAAHFLLRKEFVVHPRGVVLITGASSGIGRDAALRMASAGYTVFAGVRKASDAEAMLNSKVRNMIPVVVDVTNHDQCVSAISAVAQYMEKYTLPFVGLVNNAGISRRSVAEFHSLEDIRKVYDTNVFGLIDITQLAMPLLRKSKGRIVMISSIAGFFGAPGSSVYASSKFAVEGFSDALRREVAQFGVSVSIVEPGYVATNIFEKSELAMEHAPQNTASADVIMSLYPSMHSEEAMAKRTKNLEKAHTTECTSDAIYDALTSAFPRSRYPVAGAAGLPAPAIAFLTSHFPDTILDGLFAKV